jgi:hypothetical protein
MDLAWDGFYLWHADVGTDMIYKLTTNGTIIDSFAAPDSNPYGLTFQPMSEVIECYFDVECGISGFLNNSYCNGNDDWDTYRNYTCNNPLTTNASCSYSDANKSKEICPNGCSNGECVIECNGNSSCGTDGWLEDDYCNIDEVWDTYRTYSCTNPGTSNSSCSFSDNNQSKETCADTCESGVCVTVECYDNNDCTADSWLNLAYCNGNDVRDTYRNYTCSNPGTSSSSCDYTDNEQLKQSCSHSCESGLCLDPDLKVKYFVKQGPSNPVANDDVVLAFMFKNIGDIDADNIEWKLDWDDSFISTGTIANLIIDQTSSITMRKHSYSSAGTYNPVLTVDYSNSIEESDETNNDKTINLDIS